MVRVIDHHLSQTMQHPRALSWTRARPVVGGTGRGIQCGDHILRAAVSDTGDDLLGGRVVHRERAAPGRRPPTIGQEAARDHVQDHRVVPGRRERDAVAARRAAADGDNAGRQGG